MKEPTDLPNKSKWPTRLAIFVLLLFAIFWSLGPFFFWILLGGSSYFIFLALYTSDIKISLFEQRKAPENPFRASQPSDRTSVPPQGITLRKVFRLIVLSFLALFVFFFLIGVFFGKDDESNMDAKSEPVKIESENSDVSEGDKVNDYTNKGNDFFSQPQYDSALKYYEKALAIDRNDQYALYNKALVYYMRQNFRGSIPIVKKCLRDHPEYNEAWWLLGDDYSSVNNYDSAIYCLERAYNNNYSDPGFLQLMAETYLKKDNRKQAKVFYLKVIAQDTTKAEVYKKLAELDPGNANEYRKRANKLEQAPK